MFFEPYIHYTVFLVFLALSIYIFAKSPRRLFNIAASLLHFSMAVFSFFYFVVSIPGFSMEEKQLIGEIGSIANFSFAFFGLWAMLAFTGKDKWARSPYFISAVFGIVVIQAVLQLTYGLARIVDLGGGRWRVTYEKPVLSYSLHALFYISLTAAFVILARYWLRSGNTLKVRQAKKIFFAGLVTFILAFSNISLNQYFTTTYVPNIYDVILLLWAFTIVQAIYRQDLFDMVPHAIARQVFEIMPTGLLLADGDNKVIVANDSFSKMSGLEQKQVLDEDLFQVLEELNFSNVNTFRDVKKVEHFQSVMTTVAGKELNILVSHSQIEDRDDKTTGKVIVIKDITELKYYESQLRKLNKSLESQVLKRTKDLLGAKEKAEESDRLKTFFLQNISHEIRTPINGIQGFSHLLKNEGISQEEAGRYADIIHKSSERLLNIVSDILNMASLHSGQVRLLEERVLVSRIIKSAIDPLLPELFSKNLKLDVSVSDELDKSKIIIDRQKIERIINKLVANAVKFTNEGSVLVHCKRDGGYLSITVQDTGIGISEEKQKQVFEVFRQAEESTSRQFGGTGLGLSIAKGYAELMGGSIELESEQGLGTCFTVMVPYKRADENMQSEGRGLEESNDNFLNNKTILVAEDELTNYIIIEEFLKNSGARLHHAKNGAEAVALHERLRPDLTLMDIKMPEKNGLDASREILKSTPGSPIIIQSAYDTENELKEARQIGVSDFISKPFEKPQLIRIIMKHIS